MTAGKAVVIRFRTPFWLNNFFKQDGFFMRATLHSLIAGPAAADNPREFKLVLPKLCSYSRFVSLIAYRVNSKLNTKNLKL